VALAVGAVGAVFYLWKGGHCGKGLRMGWGSGGRRGCLRCSGVRAFCWLVFTVDDKICVLSPNNLGDLPLHLTYIRYLARGPKFWPENPIYSGIPMHYPAGIDLFNALLSWRDATITGR